MPAEVYSVDDYNFFPQDEVHFDTNVLVDIYLSDLDIFERRRERVKAYSRCLDNVIRSKSGIVISPYVTAEFMRLFVAEKFRVRSRPFEHMTRKEYRDTDMGKKDAEEAGMYLKDFLDIATRSFKKTPDLQSLKSLVQNYAGGVGLEANDSLIAEGCLSEDLILVTEDRDFNSVDGLLVVTANRRWLDEAS